jgi:hypothetical protein
MEKVMFAGDICLTEIKPKFPPKVQQIWDDCGTHVTSMEAEQGAKEIEFFVEKLLESFVKDYDNTVWGKSTLIEFLALKGYIYE